ncbi:MAG: FkbM family methyltransferase, partial [Gammaproteobacteria bacterium]
GVDLLAHFISQGDTIFDIGANIGRFTTFASRQVGKDGQVYSFEPLPYPRKILTHMKVMRNLKQVTISSCALSDVSGDATMFIPLKDGKPQTSLAYIVDSDTDAGDNQSEHVQVITLDKFCADHSVEKVDAIKCDVEGLEYNVFIGGVHTLKKFKPVIYCEIDTTFYDRQDKDITLIFSFLKDLGYESFLPNADYTVLQRKDYQGLTRKEDFFFVHKSKLVAGLTD